MGTRFNGPVGFSNDISTENNTVETGNKVYTSGKEGIFSPGIPIGKVIEEDNNLVVSLFSDFSQITFVNVVTESIDTEDQ